MFRKILLAVLVLVPAFVVAAEQVTIPLCSDYDLDSASYIYCSTTGTSDQFWNGWRSGNAKIKTSGSSVTVTANSTGDAPFAGVSQFDELLINQSGRYTRRYVATKTDDDNITINVAADLSGGVSFSWRKRACGTAATDGIFPVTGNPTFSIGIKVDQMNAASIDITLFCRALDSVGSWVTVYTKNYTAAGSDIWKFVAPIGDECRVGMKINTDDGVDTGAAQEKITINVMAIK